MVEKQIFLSPAGAVKTAGYEQPLRLGYAKNRGVYRLTVTASGEWAGLTIRAFWHVPGGTDPPASLVEDGMVEVPALVTALPGSGCITFEGTDGNRTLTSGDLAYCVSANSGTEDGTMPEPGTPAWQAFLNAHSSGLSGTENRYCLHCWLRCRKAMPTLPPPMKRWKSCGPQRSRTRPLYWAKLCLAEHAWKGEPYDIPSTEFPGW